MLRQQTRTKADIGQLLEVLKSQGAKALKSIQDELNRLEHEDNDIQKRLTGIEQRREPMKRISEDAKAFVRTWDDVGELLEAATHEEQQQLLHHYVEVIELHAYDKKGKKGTYAMRLFPEVRPDRNFEWQEAVPIIGSIDAGSDAQESGAETKNGAADDDDNSDSLSDSDPVCITDQKAPRGGLDPNRGFVELGTFRTKRLRRLPHIEIFKWDSILDQTRLESEVRRPRRDRMRLARHYQSLLDSGVVTTRAELAKFLGVSRARVTQVLKRLN